MKRLLVVLLAGVLLSAGCISDRPGYAAITSIDDSANVTIKGSQNVAVSQDEKTSALNFIDYAQFEIHQGKHFISSNVTTLGNGATVDFLFLSGVVEVHMLWSVEHSTQVLVEFYEKPTVTNNGTVYPIYNRNRQSTSLATAKVYTGPTIAAVGTLLEPYESGTNKIGGDYREWNKWILADNTYYLFRITNQTTQTNVITLILDWYEKE